MYPKTRLDALTDGLFAVAMTLLVLDIRLPEEFHPGGHSALIQALAGLWPKILAYVISFLVLGLRWLSLVQIRINSETLSGSYARWWLLYLLLITCVPFATLVVGRFPAFAPAIWLYAGITALIAAVDARMTSLLPDLEPSDRLRARQLSVLVLLLSSILAIAVSLVLPRGAMWAYMLMLVPFRGMWPRRQAA